MLLVRSCPEVGMFSLFLYIFILLGMAEVFMAIEQ